MKIVNGSFEIETIGGSSQIYFSNGSYFGNIPFVDNVNKGKIKALNDSVLFVIESDDLIKLFLSSFRLFRAYIKTIFKLGLRLNSLGESYRVKNSSVMTVFSNQRQSGKTLFSSILAKSLFEKDSVIILDLSYDGESIFSNFNVKINKPLSQREEKEKSLASTVGELIEKSDSGIDILNVTFGSKVKINEELISPLLFVLSKKYRYIVLDLQSVEKDDVLTENVFLNSDTVFTMLKNKNDNKKYFNFYDRMLTEGQRVHYILNLFFCENVNSFSGGYLFDKFEKSSFELLENLPEKSFPEDLLRLLTKKKSAFFLEPTLLNSIVYGGLFAQLYESKGDIDVIYSSGYSSVISALYFISSNREEYIKNVEKIFSEESIVKTIDVAFPDHYIFDKKSIEKKILRLFGKNRLEMGKVHLLNSLSSGQDGRTRIFSSGDFSSVLTASLLFYPVFDEIEISGSSYSSGYPEQNVKVEDLFRTDIDEIIYLSVENSEQLSYKGDKLLGFYKKYINFLEKNNVSQSMVNNSDKIIVLKVSEKYVKIEKMIESAEIQSHDFLKS